MDTGRQHIALRCKNLCFLIFNFAYCSWRTNAKGDQRNGRDGRGRGMGQGGKGKGKEEFRDLY